MDKYDLHLKSYIESQMFGAYCDMYLAETDDLKHACRMDVKRVHELACNMYGFDYADKLLEAVRCRVENI